MFSCASGLVLMSAFEYALSAVRVGVGCRCGARVFAHSAHGSGFSGGADDDREIGAVKTDESSGFFLSMCKQKRALTLFTN